MSAVLLVSCWVLSVVLFSGCSVRLVIFCLFMNVLFVIIGCRNPFFSIYYSAFFLLIQPLLLLVFFSMISWQAGEVLLFFLTADLYARAYRFFLDLLECLLFPLLDWRTVFCFFHWRSSSCLFSVPARLLRSAFLPVTPSALFTSSCYTCCSNYLFIWRWCEHLSFMFLL